MIDLFDTNICEANVYCGHQKVIHKVTEKDGFLLHACTKCPCKWREKIEVAHQKPLMDTELPVEQRIKRSQDEKEEIIQTLAESPEHSERLMRARSIAMNIARSNGEVAVWMVKDEYVRRYGEHAWLDANGRSYWAGAIFRGEHWEAVGWTKSPSNHNDSNRVWRLKTETSGAKASDTRAAERRT